MVASSDYKVWAFFTKSGIGQSGLSVLCDVYSSDGTKIVDGGIAVEVSGGLYSYNYFGVDDDYLFIFKTDADVDQKQIPTLYGNQSLIPEDVWNSPTRTLTNVTPLGVFDSIIGNIILGNSNPTNVMEGQISAPNIISGVITK